MYAIAEMMGEEIKRVIKKSPFVAVMVDETTDVSTGAISGGHKVSCTAKDKVGGAKNSILKQSEPARFRCLSL